MPYHPLMGESLIKTLINSVLGGLIGLASGLVFAYIVSFISGILVPDILKGFFEAMPVFGMGVGSIIGVIFGAIIALKQKA